MRPATAAPLRVHLPAVVIGVDLADDGDGAIVVWVTGLRPPRERRGTRDGEKRADKEKKKTPSQEPCELRVSIGILLREGKSKRQTCCLYGRCAERHAYVWRVSIE